MADSVSWRRREGRVHAVGTDRTGRGDEVG